MKSGWLDSLLKLTFFLKKVIPVDSDLGPCNRMAAPQNNKAWQQRDAWLI